MNPVVNIYGRRLYAHDSRDFKNPIIRNRISKSISLLFWLYDDIFWVLILDESYFFTFISTISTTIFVVGNGLSMSWYAIEVFYYKNGGSFISTFRASQACDPSPSDFFLLGVFTPIILKIWINWKPISSKLW